MKGLFRPKNPLKYKGNPAQIVYRSGWELHFMRYLDHHKDVVQWGSEEVPVPYRSVIDGKRHTYYPDFFVKFRDKGGKEKSMLVEIKPAAQTKAPAKATKKTEKSKKYIKEVVTYGTNVSKWKAAEEYCKDRGWEFQLMTEKELYG
jgi:hypothetical protein